MCGNVQTSNATVYIIDAVLMPPSLIHRSRSGHQGREHPLAPGLRPVRARPQGGRRYISRMAEPLVGVIMGSRSDWETMPHAADTLEALGVPLRGARRLRAPHARPALRVRGDGRADAGSR